MSIHTLLRSRVRRLTAAASLICLPVVVAATVSAPAGASTTSFTGTGNVLNPCTGTTETLSGPVVITLKSSGTTTVVNAVWEGKTSGGDTFVNSGKATLPTSSSPYVIPLQETFAGPTGTYRATASATVFHSGSNPVGISVVYGPATCLAH